MCGFSTTHLTPNELFLGVSGKGCVDKRVNLPVCFSTTSLSLKKFLLFLWTNRLKRGLTYLCGFSTTRLSPNEDDLILVNGLCDYVSGFKHRKLCPVLQHLSKAREE